jgi:signal transduction histidine kinase
VHRIVTDYNGAIQVSSTVGTGTTVRITLPMRRRTAARPAAVVTAAGTAIV